MMKDIFDSNYCSAGALPHQWCLDVRAGCPVWCLVRKHSMLLWDLGRCYAQLPLFWWRVTDVGWGSFSSGNARGLTCSQVVEKRILHKVFCHIIRCIRLCFHRKAVLCIFTVVDQVLSVYAFVEKQYWVALLWITVLYRVRQYVICLCVCTTVLIFIYRLEFDINIYLVLLKDSVQSFFFSTFDANKHLHPVYRLCGNV